MEVADMMAYDREGDVEGSLAHLTYHQFLLSLTLLEQKSFGTTYLNDSK
jgi:hypothetical protein